MGHKKLAIDTFRGSAMDCGAAYGEAFTDTAKPHMIGAEAPSSPEFSTANDGVAAIAKRKPTTVDSARKAELITIIPRLFGRPEDRSL